MEGVDSPPLEVKELFERGIYYRGADADPEIDAPPPSPSHNALVGLPLPLLSECDIFVRTQY
jgi:hypothetical protein